MSDAPERIWADGDATESQPLENWDWDTGLWGHQPQRDGEVQYVRADLFAATLARAEKAEAALAEAVEALRPFRKMAGEMFARNWNDDNVAIALDNLEGPYRLTFRDFRNLHATLAKLEAKP